MAGSIIVSDEYGWSAQTGLYEWAVDFVLNTVNDPGTKEALKFIRRAELGVVDLRALSATGRAEVLKILREDLASAVESVLELQDPPEVQRFTRGHVKVLALMAHDVMQ